MADFRLFYWRNAVKTGFLRGGAVVFLSMLYWFGRRDDKVNRCDVCGAQCANY